MEKRNGRKKICEICVSELPLELLRDIGRHLDVSSLANVRSACKKLRRLETSEDVENAAKLLRDVFDARTKENARRSSPEIANGEEVTRRALRDAIARDYLLKNNKVDPLIALRAYEAGDLNKVSCNLLARFFGQSSFNDRFENAAIVRDDAELVYFLMKNKDEKTYIRKCASLEASDTLILMFEKSDDATRKHILQEIMNTCSEEVGLKIFKNLKTRGMVVWYEYMMTDAVLHYRPETLKWLHEEGCNYCEWAHVIAALVAPDLREWFEDTFSM